MSSRPMPAIFIAHGAPPLLDDAAWVAELANWSASLPKPEAVLMISAHWEKRPVTLGTTSTIPLLYDFSGFPQRYYEVQYPAPGAPALAARLHQLLEPTTPVMDDPARGLDHGAYIPMIAMYPAAGVPVLQLSLPTLDPSALFQFGRLLAPLRAEGILIAGSGFLTHNLRAIDFGPDPQTPAWAAEFDEWAKEALIGRDVDGLLDYRNRAPGVRQALPTHEHFVPLLVALGASIDGMTAPPTFPISGFWFGSFTRRSVEFAGR